MSLGSWIILAVTLAAFGLAGYAVWRQAKKGKGCMGGCSQCPIHGKCREKK